MSDPSGLVLIELFGGMSGGALALELLGVTVVLHVVVECCQDSAALGRRRYPGSVLIQDVKDIDLDGVERWRKMAPGVVVFLVISGSRCHDLTGLRPDAQGPRGDRSGLFFHSGADQ